MHGPRGDGASLSEGVDEFAGLVRRYRIDLLLVKRHFLRLALCLGATLGAIAYNVFHLHAEDRLHERSELALGMILCYLGVSLAVIGLVGWRLQRTLRRQPPTMRQRVMQVVDFVHRWANLLMVLAAIGHGVLMLGTLIGLDVFSSEGRILLATLAPTALVIIHGLTQIPTIDRLCAIHMHGMRLV